MGTSTHCPLNAAGATGSRTPHLSSVFLLPQGSAGSAQQAPHSQLSAFSAVHGPPHAGAAQALFQPLTFICRMSPSWAGHPLKMSPVLVSNSTMNPDEKPAITLRPLGLTAKQRMSPALTPLAKRNSCYRRQRYRQE